MLLQIAAHVLAQGVASQPPPSVPPPGPAAGPKPAADTSNPISSSSPASVVWVDAEGKVDNVRMLRVRV